MNTSVYLVSYGGLLVKMTTQELPLCLFICVFIVLEKKIKKNSSRSRPCMSGCFHSAHW